MRRSDPLTSWLILDIATAPLPNAATFMEDMVRAPSNYKDPAKIEAYIAEKQAERLEMAATDVDLCWVTGVGLYGSSGLKTIDCCGGYDGDQGPFDLDEAQILMSIGEHLRDYRSIITFGGLSFDLPVLMRRAAYLDIDFPVLNLDRYRSEHLDLCEKLSDSQRERKRSLGFYVKRHGWTDLVKPLSGAEEAKVPVTGEWAKLEQSLRHDVEAAYRLAKWLKVIDEPVTDIRDLSAEPII